MKLLLGALRTSAIVIATCGQFLPPSNEALSALSTESLLHQSGNGQKDDDHHVGHHGHVGHHRHAAHGRGLGHHRHAARSSTIGHHRHAARSRRFRLTGESHPWKDAVAYSREVTRLSDAIHEVRVKIGKIQRMAAREKRYHERQVESLKKQIRIRESQHESHSESLEDYQDRKEELYRSMMCHYVLDGFHGQNKDKKLKVLHFCTGRKSLAFAHKSQRWRFLQRMRRGHHGHRHHHHRHRHGANATGGIRFLKELGRRTEALKAEVQDLEHRNGATPTLQDLENILKQLQAQEAAMQAELIEDKRRWQLERKLMGVKEDQLGESVNDMSITKKHLRKAAWEEVKKDVCPVVMKNYHVNDGAIIEYALNDCGADA